MLIPLDFIHMVIIFLYVQQLERISKFLILNFLTGQRPMPKWPSSTWGFGYLGDLLDMYESVTSAKFWITEYGTNDLSTQVG